MAPFFLFYHFLVKYGSFDLKGKPVFYYALPSKLGEISLCTPGTNNQAENFLKTTTSEMYDIRQVT